MLEINREIRDLYKAYESKVLKPETVLDIACDFVLDLINVFGDNLTESVPLKEGWRQFAPFEFILGLNNTLVKFKESGYDALDETELALLADPGVLLGSLVRSALTSHPDSFPDEDHYQIPDVVAAQLLRLTETS
ncbi:MAG: hypothetical protein HY711_07340 [Candidatus Melainabacteria bacterium]|nr:hypothetical protein [Candidatus Melainabacteria bacterium]